MSEVAPAQNASWESVYEDPSWMKPLPKPQLGSWGILLAPEKLINDRFDKISVSKEMGSSLGYIPVLDAGESDFCTVPSPIVGGRSTFFEMNAPMRDGLYQGTTLKFWQPFDFGTKDVFFELYSRKFQTYHTLGGRPDETNVYGVNLGIDF